MGRIELTLHSIKTLGWWTIFILIILNFAAFSPHQAQAAGTVTMTIQSSQTNLKVGDSFTAAIIVEGNGQTFTSFRSDVSLQNLTMIDLQKGPVARWITEPNKTSLNFFGAVAGETSEITVYTLTLKAGVAGAASIDLSNGHVYWTDGYNVNDVLGSQTGSHYTISASSNGNPPSSEATADASAANQDNIDSNTPSNSGESSSSDTSKDNQKSNTTQETKKSDNTNGTSQNETIPTTSNAGHKSNIVFYSIMAIWFIAVGVVIFFLITGLKNKNQTPLL